MYLWIERQQLGTKVLRCGRNIVPIHLEIEDVVHNLRCKTPRHEGLPAILISGRLDEVTCHAHVPLCRHGATVQPRAPVQRGATLQPQATELLRATLQPRAPVQPSHEWGRQHAALWTRVDYLSHQ